MVLSKLAAAVERIGDCFNQRIGAFAYPSILHTNGQRPVQIAYSQTEGAQDWLGW